MATLLELHHRTLTVSRDLVRRVAPDVLGAATPCADWDLGELLAHMAGQNHGFAAAADGPSTTTGDFEPRNVAADPAGIYSASVDRVLAAVAAEGATERTWHLAEFSPRQDFPGQVALGFHLIDYVAHGWDVARAIGTDPVFDDEVLTTAVRIAEQVPDGPARLAPGAAFAPRLPTADPDADLLVTFLRLLGRDPDWRA
ncbi:TIGR03086 family metal-binding protein [Occultella gossypii]|uniref:TIGR03086 family protein n=1 Tax=Occultella gossypii TaxID=2800820 RepID=A0ABS7S705_9MICO|nr:TIGR03086 family metal-binding protein [Occultella gossypii]MBZ2196124.1 TIGR03086 family protein [Occultella gossypii]